MTADQIFLLEPDLMLVLSSSGKGEDANRAKTDIVRGEETDEIGGARPSMSILLQGALGSGIDGMGQEGFSR